MDHMEVSERCLESGESDLADFQLGFPLCDLDISGRKDWLLKRYSHASRTRSTSNKMSEERHQLW
jgi:hypothetical protein